MLKHTTTLASKSSPVTRSGPLPLTKKFNGTHQLCLDNVYPFPHKSVRSCSLAVLDTDDGVYAEHLLLSVAAAVVEVCYLSSHGWSHPLLLGH